MTPLAHLGVIGDHLVINWDHLYSFGRYLQYSGVI